MGLNEALASHRLYLDTNVFIYFLNDFRPYAQELEEIIWRIEIGASQAVTSELTLAELLVQPFRSGNLEEELRCREAIKPRAGFSVQSVTMEILEKTARLRASISSLRTPDAIHLATALVTDCDAVLTNDRRLNTQGLIPIIPLSSLAARPPGRVPDSFPPEP